MDWKLIVPPAGLAISMAEARTAARVDVDESGTSNLDAEIEAAIRTYTTEAEGETNRAVMRQTWILVLNRFADIITLKKPPLLQVDHIRFYDTNRVLRTLHPEDYQVNTVSEPGCVMPADGRAWPATAARFNAVEIQFTCGYGDDHTSVPDAIKGFIRARISEQFSTGRHADNKNVTRLLWPEVVY